MDLFCGAGPQVGKTLFWVLPTPVPFSKSQKSETGRKLSAAENREQMLNAHSWKLETRHLAAHPKSHWGLPLALTPRPAARVGAQEVSPQQLRGQKTAQTTATATHVSALS